MPSIIVSAHKSEHTVEATVHDIILGEHAVLHAPNLEEVTGNIRVPQGAELDAPKLRTAQSIDVESGKVRLPELEQVESVRIFRGGELTAVKLAKCDLMKLEKGADCLAAWLTTLKILRLESGAVLHAPRLVEVEKKLTLREDASFTHDNLRRVGLCDLQAGATLTADKLGQCADLYVAMGGTINAPQLVKTGTIYLEAESTLILNSLRTIEGDLGIGDGSVCEAAELDTIKGDLFCGARSRFLTRPGEPRIEGEKLLAPDCELEVPARLRSGVRL